MPLVVPPVTPAAPSGIRFDWIDPQSVVHDLTNSSLYFLRDEITGLGTAGSQVVSEKLPTAPGNLVRRINTPAAMPMLPFTIIAASVNALTTAVADLRSWFATGDETRQTPGYLQVTRPDGSVRVLMCYYNGGLEGDLKRAVGPMAEYDVDLFAPDPWPTGSTQTVTTWTAADVASPVSQVNEGELDAYPIWKITGPATSISVQNNTTSQGWSLVYALAAGKYVTVDTRPASQRVQIPIIDSDVVNRYPALFPGSKIFGNWLRAGTNNFTITLGGTSVATRVELRYLPRYLGMLY